MIKKGGSTLVLLTASNTWAGGSIKRMVNAAEPDGCSQGTLGRARPH